MLRKLKKPPLSMPEPGIVLVKGEMRETLKAEVEHRSTRRKSWEAMSFGIIWPDMLSNCHYDLYWLPHTVVSTFTF